MKPFLDVIRDLIVLAEAGDTSKLYDRAVDEIIARETACTRARDELAEARAQLAEVRRQNAAMREVVA